MGERLVCPIDSSARYTEEIKTYQGRFVKDCDKDIIRELKERKDSLIKIHINIIIHIVGEQITP